MSGSSDYTRTPNYALYKPNFDADIDAWGDHWNWNADTLDSTLHGLSVGQAGGPFLPLTGGILSGGLSVGSPGIRFPTMGSAAADFQWAYSASNIYAYINGTAQGPLLTQPQGDARWLQLSGGTITGELAVNDPYPSANTSFSTTVARHNSAATFPPMFAVNAGVGGSVTSFTGSPPAYFSFNTNNDGLDAKAAGGTYGLQTGITTVTGETGDRTALVSQLNVSQATSNTHPTYFGAAFFTSTANANAGGTSSAPVGDVYGINPLAQLSAGATYYDGVAAAEFNVNANTGCNVAYKTGISIIQGNNSTVHGTAHDIAVLLGNAIGAAGWKYGISFGSPMVGWGIDPAGTLIGAMTPALGGSPAYAAAWGIDFNPVTFSSGLIRGPGFSVNGGGSTMSSGLGITAATGATIYDLSKHISLYGAGAAGGGFGFSVTANSLNHVTGAGSIHNFIVGTTQVCYIDANGFEGSLNGTLGQSTPYAATVAYLMVGAGGPTWTQGSGAPSGAQPAGSLYSRTGGAVGTHLYVSAGGGTWNPVAGV